MLHSFTQIIQKLSPGLKKILGNIGWLFAERIMTLILTFCVGILVIRYLGSENFGKLSYCISLIALFSVIPKLGLNQIVTRNLVKTEKANLKILGTAFIFQLISSLIVVFMFNLAVWSINDLYHLRWILVLISMSLLLTAFDTIECWFQSQVLSGKLALMRSVQIILSSLSKILFISFKFPLIAFAGLILAESIFKAVGMVIIYVKYDRPLSHWQLDWNLGRKMLKDSWPLILSGIMITIYLKIDQVMLGNMTTAQEMGNYAAAVRFSEIFYFLPGIICSSVFPAILRAKEISQTFYYNRLQQLYDMMAWLSLMIAFPMMLIAVPLLTNLLGQEYISAGHILAWHIWASPFVFLGLARSQWLISENYVRFSLLSTSLGAIVNVGLNLLLIPTYSGLGAAIATLISYAVAVYGTCLLYPPMYQTGWMLTKALCIPFRIRQNLTYLQNVRKLLKFSS